MIIFTIRPDFLSLNYLCLGFLLFDDPEVFDVEEESPALGSSESSLSNSSGMGSSDMISLGSIVAGGGEGPYVDVGEPAYYPDEGVEEGVIVEDGI